MIGVVLLLASVITGALWSRLGPPATFLAGATFTAAALAGIVLIRPAPRVMTRGTGAPQRLPAS